MESKQTVDRYQIFHADTPDNLARLVNVARDAFFARFENPITKEGGWWSHGFEMLGGPRESPQGVFFQGALIWARLVESRHKRNLRGLGRARVTVKKNSAAMKRARAAKAKRKR